VKNRDLAIVGFGLTLILLALGGNLGYHHASRLIQNRRLVEHTHVVINELETLLSTLKDAETGQRGYLLAEDESYLEPYSAALTRLHGSLDRLSSLTADNPDQVDNLASLRPQIARRLEELERTVDLVRQGDRDAALAIVRSDEGKQLMDAVRNAVADMQALEEQLLEQRADESEHSYRLLVSTLVVTTLTGLALLISAIALNRRAIHVRERAAETIAQQREQLHVTLQSIGDAVIATDADGRVTFLNPIAHDLTGWREADAQGVKLEDVFHIVNEDTRQPVDNPALRALREGAIVGLANHTVLISKDGSERAIDDSAAPIRDAAGAIRGAILVFRDVSEHRKASRALAESEARKTAMLDAAIDCVISCDHEGKIIEFNPAAERTFGYRREDVVGREMSDIIVPHNLRDRHQQGMRRHFETGQSRILGKRVVLDGLRADGTVFPIELSINRIETPGHPQFTAYLRDITEQQQAELAAAERLRHAALNADIGVALTSNVALSAMLQACTDSLVRNLQGAFARIWTHNEAEHVLELQASSGTYTHLDGPHGRVPVGKFKIGMIAESREPHLTNEVIGDPLVPEQEWASREGLVAFAGYPLIVKDRLIGVMAMFAKQPLSATTLAAMEAAARGIALGVERKEIEDELRQVAASLSEADRRKDEFLATLAHELRNPLAPLRYGLELIRREGDQTEQMTDVRSLMERQLGQMVRLVDDLMDVSRVSRGKLELRRERVELADVVRSAVEATRPLIDEMGHELTVELPTEPLLLDADATRLAQVLLNLLNNAAKYSERGGRIWLTATRYKHHVVVSVRDAGIGIAADQLPQIFRLFTQVDRSLEKSQGGLGIGLTLVKRLVEMHGGTIEAKSDGPGRGSEFVLTLPLAATTAAATTLGAANAIAPQRTNLRILVVDDNRDGARSLSLMLRMMGNETSTANDGEEGVDLAERIRPDVVLLDIGLPKLNGYEACRRIRQQPWAANVLLIAVTGWGQDEDRRRSQEAGFDHHIVKPVDPRDLMKLLAEWKR
jgi:PAS domain S-box-containing protein